jgi:YD repeat-containing protein
VTIDPLSGRTTLTYDAEGQQLTSTDPLGNVTSHTYSSRGFLATTVDPMGTTSTYTYTNTGKLDSVFQQASGGSPYSVGYAYDDADRRIAETDGLGHATTWCATSCTRKPWAARRRCWPST